MPSTPAIATWNRKRSGVARPVAGFGLSVTHAAMTCGRVELAEPVLDREPVDRRRCCPTSTPGRCGRGCRGRPARRRRARLDAQARVVGAQPVHDRVDARVCSIQSRSGSALPGQPASLNGRFMSHLRKSMSCSPTSPSSHSWAHSATSGRAKLSTSWLRISVRCRLAMCSTQSGCGAVQVAVRVDHLRLDPQAEAHAERGAPPPPAGAARAGTDPGWAPVAEPGAVASRGAEPAVVHDEQLDAEAGGQLGQCQLVRLVDVEPGRLPGVVEHRARLVRVRQHVART